MAETLNGALNDLLKEPPGEVTLNEAEVESDEVEGGETAVTEPVPTRSPLPADANVEALVESANAHYEAAEAAQRDGDWATYGAEIDALQLDLERLMELVGETE